MVAHRRCNDGSVRFILHLYIYSTISDSYLQNREYERNGNISYAMYLVFFFQCFYVMDALWYEPCIVTSMDITTDGFGMMLAFGDLSWVPILYSLQARYLATHPVELEMWAVVGIVGLKIIGLILFRGANLQKDRFRRDPSHPSVKGKQEREKWRSTGVIKLFFFFNILLQICNILKPNMGAAYWLTDTGKWHVT